MATTVYRCTFTTHKGRKRKIWKDGTLKMTRGLVASEVRADDSSYRDTNVVIRNASVEVQALFLPFRPRCPLSSGLPCRPLVLTLPPWCNIFALIRWCIRTRLMPHAVRLLVDIDRRGN